jgi:hypothetical protein
MLYIRIQSAVTIFDHVLNGAFGEQLINVLPRRAYPVAATPPADVAAVVQKDIEAICTLLSPGRRQSTEAEARLRAILDLEAAVGGRTDPPQPTEIHRAARALREGAAWQNVFPGVASLRLDVGDPNRIPVSVKLTRGQGSGVRLAGPGEEALLYREVNPLDRWSVTFKDLKNATGLGQWKLRAVLDHLGYNKPPHCYDHELSTLRQRKWTPAVKDDLTARLADLDIETIFAEYSAGHAIGKRVVGG